MAIYVFTLDSSIYVSSVNPDDPRTAQHELESNMFEVKNNKLFSEETYKNIIRNVLSDGINKTGIVVVS